MVFTQNKVNWWNSCEDCNIRLPEKNAWICPWCFSCAAKHFQIPDSKSGELCWRQMASEIRQNALAPTTIKAYQQGFKKAEWPLDSPFRMMAYLDKAPSSDAALKQWITIANRIHESRLWPRPNFQHPLVRDFINGIKHRKTATRPTAQKKETFNEKDLKAMFKCLQENKYPTDKRNWAILIVQLFGVRRASEVLTLRASDVHVVDQTFVIRGLSKKTDKRQKGIFFKLPRSSIFGFDPADVFAKYILTCKGNSTIIFPSYDTNTKRFTKTPMSVNAWNRAIKRLCLHANVKVATSHAIRRSAITLSPIELVEAVAQTGGWRSLCFWEVYRRFDIDQRAHAVSQIGKRNPTNEKTSVVFI